jgi:transcriptional regulator GlxA family with amidase domain
VEQIAAHVGFNSAVVLREHFRREIGLAPVDYRRRFVAPRPAPPVSNELELSA